MREDFRSSTSEFRKVETDRFDPLNSGRHLGAPVCTLLLMNYVGCIITEPHIFSSVSDAPEKYDQMSLENYEVAKSCFKSDRIIPTIS